MAAHDAANSPSKFEVESSTLILEGQTNGPI